MIKILPFLLVASRFVIAPLLLWNARKKSISGWFVPLLVFAFLSDFLDGYFCRNFGGGSRNLTFLDGIGDSLLYLSAFLCLCWVRPEIIKKYQFPLMILLSLQVFSWSFSLVKFGKLTSYHTYAVKFWGVLLLVALVESFLFHKGRFIIAMVLVGSLCLFEDITITSVMPYWKYSIKGIGTALQLARQHLLSQTAAHPQGRLS